MDAGRFADAIDVLERLWGERPMEHCFGVRLAYCAQMLGQTAFQRQVVDALLGRRKAETEPARIARRVALFLGTDTDEPAMAAVVDPSLHRQKKARVVGPGAADDANLPKGHRRSR